MSVIQYSEILTSSAWYHCRCDVVVAYYYIVNRKPINFSFASINTSDNKKPQYVIFFRGLTADSMKPNKLDILLERLHWKSS